MSHNSGVNIIFALIKAWWIRAESTRRRCATNRYTVFGPRTQWGMIPQLSHRPTCLSIANTEKYWPAMLTLQLLAHYCSVYSGDARCSYAWLVRHYLFIALCGWGGGGGVGACAGCSNSLIMATAIYSSSGGGGGELMGGCCQLLYLAVVGRCYNNIFFIVKIEKELWKNGSRWALSLSFLLLLLLLQLLEHILSLISILL